MNDAHPSWTWDIPEYYNIGVDVADRHAADPARAQRFALRWENEDGERRLITFKGMAARSNQLGNLLRELGMAPGDRMLLRLPSIPEFQISFLGALKTGVVPVPSSTLFKGEELTFLLNDCEARCLVTTHHDLEPVREAARRSRFLRHILVVGSTGGAEEESWAKLVGTQSTEMEPLRTKAEDLAYQIYTSGTQGHPKGVLHAHRALPARDPSSLYWLDLKPEDVVCNASRLNWTYAIGTGFLDPLRQGCTTVVYDGPPNARRWWEVLDHHRVTVFLAVPTFYRHLLQKPEDFPVRPRALRRCCSAGEHLAPSTLAEWRRRMELDIFEGLGMSEFSYHIAQDGNHPVKPGSCGRPLPGHETTVIDAEGHPVPPGVVGHLATPRTDPGIMLGYWRNPEEEAKVFQGEWFVGGDLFRKDEDGDLYILGRADDTINSFGYRISPLEIERVLHHHPAVGEVAVVGLDLSEEKTLVAAFVILRAGGKPDQDLQEALKAHCRKHMADYKVPKEIRFLDQLPKTSNGKIRRSVLKHEHSRYRP